jgi:hypothetical protein
MLFSFMLALPTFAQQEEDFASSFMKLNGEEEALQCVTVSPSMMERILQIPDDSVECDSLLPLLEQIKSVRIISSLSTVEQVNLLYEKAEVLAEYHPLGYQEVVRDENCTIYQRRRADCIVELIMIMQRGTSFCLIDLTGNMTDDFLSRLSGSNVKE